MDNGQLDKRLDSGPHRRHCLFLTAALIYLLSGQAAAYFKCTDGQGGTTFQEFPCPEAAEQVEEKIRGEHRSTDTPSGVAASRATTSGELRYTKPYPEDNQVALSEAPVIRSRLSSALASLTPIRSLMTEFFVSNGAWPTQFAEIGLQERELSSDQIETVRLEAEGVLVARLDPVIGADKFVALQPQIVLGGTSIEWQCFANFPEAILNLGGAGVCLSRVID